jgi:hypothetical protein
MSDIGFFSGSLVHMCIWLEQLWIGYMLQFTDFYKVYKLTKLLSVSLFQLYVRFLISGRVGKYIVGD